MGAAEPNLEGFFEDKKLPRNPASRLCRCLNDCWSADAGDLISFKLGNSQLGQIFMRARVVWFKVPPWLLWSEQLTNYVGYPWKKSTKTRLWRTRSSGCSHMGK